MIKAVTAILVLFTLMSISLCVAQVSKGPGWELFKSQEDISQNTQIECLRTTVTDLRVDTAARLVALETKVADLQEEVSSLSKRMWAMLSGIVALLLNSFWALIKPRRDRPRPE
jgi:hypothetical protein